MPRHKLTAEERARGGFTRAAKARAEREEAELLVAERLSALTERAVARLEGLLESEDDMVAFRAAREVFDRVLGRSRQPHEHSGHIGLDLNMDVARAKLDTFIERRAEQMGVKAPRS